MKRTSKALIAALVCAAAVTFSGCGNSTEGSQSENNSLSGGSSIADSSANSAGGASSAGSETPGGASSMSGESSAVSQAPESSEAPESSSSADESSGGAFSALWEGAKYTEDTEIGEGAHSVLIDVTIGGKTVTITVKSDKDNLAEMLTESGLAEGEDSAYGLYIKKVNGVLADYDIDQSYWGLNKDGAPTAVGASSITVEDGERYELAYVTMDEEQPAA